MEKFVVKPNLPQARVSTCLVGDENAISDLNLIGISSIKVNPCADLALPVNSHPDMLFHHLGGRKVLAYHLCQAEITQLVHMNFEVTTVTELITQQYPYDIMLNAARVGDFVFCNKPHTYKDIVSHGIPINVRQGYAKCSILIVDENSIITADNSIYESALANGFSVLKIAQGDIHLEGYDYGFIGGCGVKIDKHTMFFTGDIIKHSDGEAIIEFIESRGISYICGSYSYLTDVGSILPLNEK